MLFRSDGLDPDPNGNGDPTEVGEDDPTPIAVPENPVLGVAKSAAATVDNGDGTFDSAITVTVENLGNVDLSSLQVTDDLTATFPAPASYVIQVAPASGTLTPNAAFDGNLDQNLLAGTDGLAVGATATITFTVRFDPNGASGPFNNTEIGRAHV